MAHLYPTCPPPPFASEPRIPACHQLTPFTIPFRRPGRRLTPRSLPLDREEIQNAKSRGIIKRSLHLFTSLWFLWIWKAFYGTFIIHGILWKFQTGIRTISLSPLSRFLSPLVDNFDLDFYNTYIIDFYNTSRILPVSDWLSVTWAKWRTGYAFITD